MYLNGNYIVYWKNNTLIKRALRAGEKLVSEFPDSIDLKVTNKCSWGCEFCHESSIPGGKCFNYEHTVKVLSELPDSGIEIALGGGNLLESAKRIIPLEIWLFNSKNAKLRGTFNIRDIFRKKYTKDQEDLVYRLGGIGVSIPSWSDLKSRISSHTFDNLRLMFRDTPFELIPFKAFHIIAGIFPSNELLDFCKHAGDLPILVLGFKQWGRSALSPIPPDLINFKKVIWSIIQERNTNITLAFDNLALEQLDIKNAVGQKTWEKFYMGDDGEFSMYIDAVSEVYAKNSIFPERVSWKKTSLLEFFRNGKTINNN